MNFLPLSAATMFWLALVVVLLAVIVALWRSVKCNRYDVDWVDLVASREADGALRADVNKLGKVIGLVVSTWLVMRAGAAGTLDPTMFGVWLAFVAGVDAYAQWQRSIDRRTEVTYVENTPSQRP